MRDPARRPPSHARPGRVEPGGGGVV